MGRTYQKIWTESRDRWVAERANIMESMRSQLKDKDLLKDRNVYGIRVENRPGKYGMYMRLKLDEDDTSKNAKKCDPKCIHHLDKKESHIK